MNHFATFLRRTGISGLVAGISTLVSLFVHAQSPPLAVQIVQPAAGDVINVGDAASWSVQVAAHVFGGSGGLTVVEFFGDGQSLGSATGNPASASPINPFQVSWPNPARGEHSVQAMVISADGVAAKSNEVKFKVVQSGDPVAAVVTVGALKKEASEWGDSRSRTLMFEVRRRGGDLALSMPVFYWLAGSAKAGLDYTIVSFNGEVPPAGDDPTVPPLSSFVTIPPGMDSATIMLAAKSDELVEGDESVIVVLQPAPFSRPFDPLRDYVVGEPSEAQGVIHDSPAATESSLVITYPEDLQYFPGPTDIRIEAVATDPKSAINFVEFFANGERIGESGLVWDITPPPGSPIRHHLLWKSVPSGKYILTAKAKDSAGQELVSAGVRVAVDFPGSEVPVVTIETTDPEAAEPEPANIGVFRIDRIGGDLSLPLKVQFGTDGSAERGVDYALIPESMFIPCPACDRPEIIIEGDNIEIPAGERSVLLGVRATPDKALEGVESVAILLLPSDGGGNPDGAPTYRVGEPAVAKLAIVESPTEPPGAHLTLVAPKPGETFTAPADIFLQVIGRDPNGALTHVEFYGDELKIGESEIVFIQPPEPGTPLMHEFLWKGVPVGEIKLTARSFDASGVAVISNPVVVHVLSDPPPPLAFLTITSPASGEAYPGPQDRLRISVQAQDPGGIFETVEIFANGEKLGDAMFCCPECLCLVPEAGMPSLFTFDWRNVGPGVYEIVALGRSTSGRVLKSEPVKIVVQGDLPPPLAFIKITSPESGKLYVGSQDSIRISLQAQDADGIFEAVEILANGVKIGDAMFCCPECRCVAPEAGKPTPFTFDWLNVGPGVHEIVALGKSTSGLALRSDPVKIVVQGEPPPPLAFLKITDPEAGKVYPGAQDRIRISVQAQDPGGVFEKVEIFANGEKLGDAMFCCPECLCLVPEAGMPSLFTFDWRNVGPGEYHIVAVGKSTSGLQLNSDPVKIVVQGEPPPPLAFLKITDPLNGAVLPGPVEHLSISLLSQDPNGVFETVEVFANGQKLGTAMFCCPVCDCAAPAPGKPTLHTFVWNNVQAGTYEIAARGKSSSGLELASEPIKIVVLGGGADDLPVATVITKDDTASENDPADIAIFRILRTGPTDLPLTVRFEMHGPAEREVDYHLIPESMFIPCPRCGRPEIIITGNTIEIPAGESSVLLGARASLDELPEGMEGLVVEITPPPVIAIPGARPAYLVGSPAEARAVIVEKIVDPTLARIVITHPPNGNAFPGPATIEINATAVDPRGYIPRVEFLAGEAVIGESEIVFVQPPDPGTPIHHTFAWKEVGAGEYKLRVRGMDSNGVRVISEPVLVVVHGPNEPVIVSIKAMDPEASEPGANPDNLDHGTFVLTRTGLALEPLTVFYTVEGTAKNGEDYMKLDGDAIIPAGMHSRRITVVPLADGVAEGNETAVLTLLEGGGYQVGDPHAARVVIRDADQPDSKAPRLVLIAPGDGKAYKAPADISVEAVAMDPDGYIEHVDFFANGGLIGSSTINFFQPPEPGTPITHTFLWKGVEVGEYKITAECIDASGLKATSEPVKIVVFGDSEPPLGFVVRDLPGHYQAGVKFLVSLDAKPGDDVKSYGVEETPPRGWSIGAMSHDGRFDAATGQVKFGPFLDHESRKLTYELTPPADADGRVEFSGIGSTDGGISRVLGDRLLAPNLLHPADRQSADNKLVLGEVTTYSAAWKAGESWPGEPNPIPVAYVTRAGALWRGGEQYILDLSAGPPPLWWVNPPAAGAIVKASPPFMGASVALREYAAGQDGAWKVAIRVLPQPGVASYAVEERVPDSAGVENVTEDGVFDAKAGVIRWGPFGDGEARTLTYSLRLSDASLSLERLHGIASFDGADVAVLRTGVPESDGGAAKRGARLVDVLPVGDDLVQVTLEGEPDASGYDLEVSTDLKTWTKAGEFLPGDFSYYSLDTRPQGDAQRFYRAVRKP